MTLNELEIGETGTVVSVSPDIKTRLAALGIIPGTRITYLRAAPTGNPLAFRIAEYSLAMRRRDAEKIVIEKDGV